MITGISIENFKGIRERVEIELRPLTLLFGANSAGKSSILHALHYAREIFERQNLNPDRTRAGGEYVDLGGFERFVHGHDLRRRVGLAVSVDLRNAVVPTYQPRLPAGGPTVEPDPLIDDLETATVQVVVGWSELLSRPCVEEFTVDINGAWLASLTFQPGRREVRLRFEPAHPVFVLAKDHRTLSYGDSDIEPLGEPETGIGYAWRQVAQYGCIPALSESGVDVEGQVDAFVDLSNGLKLSSDKTALSAEDWQNAERMPEWIEWIESTLSTLIAGTGSVVRDCLTSARYIGPVRDTPSRNYEPPRHADPARWASGLGAWDRLATADDALIDAVSHWLGDENRLNSGYRLRRKRFKELDLDDPLVVQLLTGRAFDDADIGAKLELDKLPTHSRVLIVPVDGSIELRPNDVGIGISQVVPVIVTALDGAGRFVAIEQPELHLHPRLQAELADLFLEACREQQHRFLIETHSEHCILRIQRRIRETSKGEPAEGRSLMSEDVVVYHVSTEDNGTRVRRIDVDKHGEFVQPWPDDFFEIDFYERVGHDR